MKPTLVKMKVEISSLVDGNGANGTVDRRVQIFQNCFVNILASRLLSNFYLRHWRWNKASKECLFMRTIE